LIDPTLISADDTQRAPHQAFRTREFRRVVVLTRPYVGPLVVGLIATVAFAGLHTTSIGGAFPVFQILLEEEGLHGWADRVIAGHRLDVEFEPQSQSDFCRLLRVSPTSELFEAGVRAGDELLGGATRPVTELFTELARIQAGVGVPTLVRTRQGERSVLLHAKESEVQFRLLRWGVSLLPPDRPETKLWTLGYVLVCLVATAILSNVFRYVGEVLIAGAVLRAMMDLRDQLYERTLHLPMVYFADTPTADIVTRFVQDIQEIQRGLVTLFGKFIREPMRAFFLLGLALALDWRITLTMASAVPLAVIFFWTVGRSVKKANRRLLQAYGHMIGALTASLQNLRVVKTYTAEAHEQAQLDQVDHRMFQQQLRLAKLDAFLSPTMETLAVLAGSLLTIWLAGRVLDHELSLSRFASLGVTLSMLFDPLRKMSDVYVRIQRSTAGAERIFHVLDHPVEADRTHGNIELAPLQRAIEFVDVSFTYPGSVSPTLERITLTIHHGETVAIVGPNGCGKTTLLSMLPRLYDPDTGEVRYDGRDIRQAALKSLRRQMSIVSQEAIVFGGTPLDNIAYGQAPVDRERAVNAAVRAHADEFIRNLPGGYEAALGERGSTLSGGERQRLAIARAIYRDAPILIFDEATSQIDSESELKIQTALREFVRGRTTIIIAHRLSTIQFANRIIVMNAGRVIDTGSHKELFDRCTLYRTLCDTQLVGERET